MSVAAVTGLRAEARLAQRLGLRAVAGGGVAAATERQLAALLAEGVAALVSFGIAGGLAPDLAGGTLVAAEAVVDEAGGRLPVSDAWRDRLVAALAEAGIAVAGGSLLGAAAIVASPSAKAALHRRTGAVAVDLESHLAARAAAGAGLPFLVLRVIADPATRGLPRAALVGLTPEGRPALAAVLAALARHPAQLPALIAVAGDTRRAMAALGRGGRAARLVLGAAPRASGAA